ncbi:VanZ like protein [Salsuginibacillus halophilus]|uniref:VanZ like protein n=1 Tax=Salsuginibacillus halophilus TaxID=517424 RepID=A0A2P8HYP0_9BACI|nr:VanZ family protein [Salsuginibacillus halophilus]PSL51327.1 VanZ like protein [Salsuginibacillus halophilus]
MVIRYHIKPQAASKQTWLITAAFFLYTALMLYVTLFAWNYGASLNAGGPGGRNYNLTPLHSIYRILMFSPDWSSPIRILVGNVVLFMPFGFLLAFLWRRAKPWLSVMMCGAFFSLFIEITQFLFTYRVANVDDVILNTTGTAIGAACAITFKKKQGTKQTALTTKRHAG